jgi:hypothetical protein
MSGRENDPGIMERTFRDILTRASFESDEEINVWVSYLEIYNEGVKDMLDSESSNLKIVDD